MKRARFAACAQKRCAVAVDYVDRPTCCERVGLGWPYLLFLFPVVGIKFINTDNPLSGGDGGSYLCRLAFIDHTR